MAVALSQFTADLTAAINTRLKELGHSLPPSHISALVADIHAVIVADSGTAISGATADVGILGVPAHGKF